ncbi:MAG: precorrin-3B C(17)-methyltransferase [Chloroflexi bacterium]|nr:precorrin-3B C(17)-methyltransferase [Chloroflexota bacterium]
MPFDETRHPAGELFVVGLGPGDPSLLAPRALDVLGRVDTIVGYRGYLDLLGERARGKRLEPAELGEEIMRAEHAVALAADGHHVALVSSGDAGVYGMASPAFEALERRQSAGLALPAVEVVPGITALLAAGALLGAPLGNDFAAISLSDLLTPWEQIERRLLAAAEGDFVIALYNPRSGRRQTNLERARHLLLRYRSDDTPVGHVRQAYRQEQRVSIVTLAELSAETVDMFSLLIVGNSVSRRAGQWIVTPRGYRSR